MISQEMMGSLMSESTDYSYPILVDIVDPTGVQDTLRFTNNNVDITYDDGTTQFLYHWFPFSIKLPPDTEKHDTKSQIQITNVKPEIITLLRSITKKPEITLNIVAVKGEDPSPVVTSIEKGPIDMELQDYNGDAQTITGTLGYKQDFLNQTFPRWKFTPGLALGVFS